MRIPRLYQSLPLALNTQVSLTESAVNHAIRVLRLSIGNEVILFNGEGGEYTGVITHINKQREVVVTLTEFHPHDIGSGLQLHLGQVISRGERMDFTIQKAVELGVSAITPLFSERCEVKLIPERRDKKMTHWQGIITHACEQSGRTQVPILHLPQQLTAWVETCEAALKLTLDPVAQYTVKTLNTHPTYPSDLITQPQTRPIALLIGAEGGLSDREIHQAQTHDFIGLRLGPRVLRTETAGLAAISALQCWLGDMG